MLKLKKSKRGAVMIEAAFVLPLFFLLLFGIFEAYRMKVAQKLVENISINVVSATATSATMTADKIVEIIKTCSKEADMTLVKDSDIDSRIRCGIQVYIDHDTAKASAIPTTWPTSQGIIEYPDGGSSLERGYTIAVTAFIKYEFLTQLTKSAFTRSSGNTPFYIRSRNFMKRS